MLFYRLVLHGTLVLQRKIVVQVAFVPQGILVLQLAIVSEDTCTAGHIFFARQNCAARKTCVAENTYFVDKSCGAAKTYIAGKTCLARPLAELPDSGAQAIMEGVAKYTGGTGVTLANFIRNCRSTYQKMLRDPREQQLDGFGEYDFLARLAAALGGEARDVYNLFMDEWDFTILDNPNQAVSIEKEARRDQWRVYRRDVTAQHT